MELKMLIHDLSRYPVSGNVNTFHNYMEVEQQTKDLRECLNSLIAMLQSEIDFEACGDAGSWDVFETEHVKVAVKALEKATGKKIKELL